jgi:hypothetical protein
METSSGAPAAHIPSAPWIPIPDKRIICIEHPGSIRNLDKGIATIGGQEALIKAGLFAPSPQETSMSDFENLARSREWQYGSSLAISSRRPNAAPHRVALRAYQ